MRTIVLLPVYNEGQTLGAVLERLVPASDAVIAVDDGSVDDSPAILRAWAERDPRLMLIRSEKNQGKSKALEIGFREVLARLERGLAAPDDAVVATDADGQIPAEIVGEAVSAFAARRLDMLIGARDFGLYPPLKKLGNAVITKLASLLAGFPFRDTLCGFRVIRAGRVAELVEWGRARRYACEQELSMIAVLRGMRTANDFAVPTAHFRSNSTWRDAAEIAVASFSAWRRLKKRSPRPSL
jgi:glycosyltransferase involved in cell wall biosynthesis